MWNEIALKEERWAEKLQTRNRKPHDISRQCRSLGEIIIRKPDRCLHEDPRKITDCGLFSFYLAAQCKQGQASVSEGFSEAHTSRCFFISRCRPGCLGWWGPSVTHSGTSYEGIRLPRCTGGPRIRGSLWSDSFGHEPTSVGRLDYRLFALIFSKTHFLRHEIHSRYTITITRIVYAIVLF